MSDPPRPGPGALLLPPLPRPPASGGRVPPRPLTCSRAFSRGAGGDRFGRTGGGSLPWAQPGKSGGRWRPPGAPTSRPPRGEGGAMTPSHTGAAGGFTSSSGLHGTRCGGGSAMLALKKSSIILGTPALAASAAPRLPGTGTPTAAEAAPKGPKSANSALICRRYLTSSRSCFFNRSHFSTASRRSSLGSVDVTRSRSVMPSADS
mmetsp:Transcript_88096/g.247705  ORF Transcript_88096/g.247705 Transcript_88096/m.247705 type:complete len:205 (-) Transcript_88096:255-869(-)